ncbi:MAG: flagellar biosynthesis protein FlhF [Lachnospiraceae bacterium]|nr:flagellar biosynthesis protein FlhF [Lachnospiraceae bacterium]
MIIKKYEAETENDAIMMAKEELGGGAVIMNIRTAKPKGIFKLFRKPLVEVTAAVDEKTPENPIPAPKPKREQAPNKVVKEEPVVKPVEEKKLDTLAEIIEKQISSEGALKEQESKKIEQEKEQRSEKVRTLLYNQFLRNEVDEKYAHMLVEDVTMPSEKEEALDAVLASVYQRIVLKLGQPQVIKLNQKKPRICFFIGSTGVGKTTTIAKIASLFKLEKKAKVAMVTSDTYRIAAVEQLKTYANILSLPIRVVYTPIEMEQAVKDYADYDLVLVDTAGRSPKNAQQMDELADLLSSVPVEQREVYLVLSATTKYKDLKQIVSIYRDISDYRIVFTKLDETSCYGNILNIRLDTNAALSYVTCGQIVPDDLGMLNAQAIAKQLLGGCE